MAEPALYALLAWLSPSFPVGSYSFSHGLEHAVFEQRVVDRAGLVAWIEDVLGHGGGWSDAVFLAHAHRAAGAGDTAGLALIAEQAEAMAPTLELHRETMGQGAAFAATVLAAWPDDAGRLAASLKALPAPPYPVAVGIACAAHGVPRAAALTAYLHAVAANLVSAALRLAPIGQTDGQRALAALGRTVAATAARAEAAELDDLGTASLTVDWCSMRHETQTMRLFRS